MIRRTANKPSIRGNRETPMKYLIILLSLALLPVVAEALTERQINDLIAKTSETSATVKQLDKRLTLIEQDLRDLSGRVDANKTELSKRMDANKTELSSKIDTGFYTLVGFQITILLALAGFWFKEYRPTQAKTTQPEKASPPHPAPEALERLTPKA